MDLFKTRLFCIAACFFLASCGSDNDSNKLNDPASAGDRVGYFLDSAVSGITYARSDGFTGVTTNSGEFRYFAGDTIEFKVGDVMLGVLKTPGGPNLLTPVGLFYTTPLSLTPSASSADHREVLNKLIFLQTLDTDGDPTNGIQISPQAVNVFKGAGIDFDISTDDFSTGDFAAKIAELNTMGTFSGATPRSVQTKLAALRHFDSLNVTGQSRYTARYSAWWQEQNGCADIGESALYLDAAQVKFCPNLNGFDGCYDGVVLEDGQVLLAEMKSNQICAENPTEDFACSGYQQTTLQANLTVQGDVIEGNYQASCKNVLLNQIQTVNADFLLMRTSNDTNSIVGPDLTQSKQQLFEELENLTHNKSCNTNGDCNFVTVNSWHACYNRHLTYSTIDSVQEMDLLNFKTHVYEDIEAEGQFDFVGGTISCFGLPVDAQCVENACTLVDHYVSDQI